MEIIKQRYFEIKNQKLVDRQKSVTVNRNYRWWTVPLTIIPGMLGSMALGCVGGVEITALIKGIDYNWINGVIDPNYQSDIGFGGSMGLTVGMIGFVVGVGVMDSKKRLFRDRAIGLAQAL